VNATAPAPIICRVTLRRTEGGMTLYGIVSPKTSRRLEVAREYLADLPRVAGRIVHGIGRGLQATFTVEELRAFHAAYQRQTTPRPLRYWGKLPRKTNRPALTISNTPAEIQTRLAQLKESR
jgi:hypothetical protein